jgi:hypothetical protein
MMPVPWLQLIDAALGLANFARGRRAVEPGDEQQQQQQLESAARTPGGLEARMAGVVVAALKEAFDRDSRRLELEREQAAVERERMERALRLELQRQAADREIGRLRMLAAVAVAGWIGTLLLAMLPGGIMRAGTVAKVALGGGWLLLGAAVAVSFIAQGRVATVLASLTANGGTAAASAGGESTALWLLVAGLALVGIAVLMG